MPRSNDELYVTVAHGFATRARLTDEAEGASVDELLDSSRRWWRQIRSELHVRL